MKINTKIFNCIIKQKQTVKYIISFKSITYKNSYEKGHN